MKRKSRLNNLQELNVEIARIQQFKLEQESYLLDQYSMFRHKIETPRRFFNAITSAIPGGGIIKGVVSAVGKASRNEDADWLTRALQLGAPFLLNSTFLRNSGWLKKALVLLASETAIGKVNQDNVSGLLGKITNFIRPKKRKKKRNEAEVLAAIEDESPEFGLPPNSESY